ncbi:MAG: serine/threonine-protein kinase, partial [Phycisphaerales bacterium]|nr:serine/threonine-protein kinase [Phycisphaerales bacterium]
MILDSRIQELLSRWEAADPGRRPSVDELCADCPELKPRLQEYIQRLASTDRHLAVDEVPPPQIPGYEITAPLGRGGMGVVWRATQLATKRPVALKTIAAGLFASPRAAARFEREVELASRLNHPHIARVYDSGITSGMAFYAMELVEGMTLEQFVRDRGLSRRQILELMILICQAVQHAHQYGVIHRDLKPSNILVDADGHPRLLDFGLAKAAWADPSPQITLDDAPGTPAYMSPEQASGQLSAVGTTSDVYSLGVILYLLLLGRLPHDDTGGALAIMQRVVNSDPTPPRLIDPAFPRDLTAILLKALARTPQERYRSADELARDLRRWLDGLPIQGTRMGLLYTTRKFIRRHRRRLTVAGVIAAAVMAIAAVASVQVLRERDRATTNEQIASAVNRFLLDMLGSADPEGAGGPIPSLPELLHRASGGIEGSFPDQPLVEAAIRQTVSDAYVRIGDSLKAEPHARAALSLRSQTMGEFHPQTLTARGDLAFVLYNSDRAHEAELLLRPALEHAQNVLGPDHSTTLALMRHFIASLYYQSRAEEAEPIARQAFQTLLRTCGKDDPQTLSAAETLASVLIVTGGLDEAEQLILESMQRLPSEPQQRLLSQSRTCLRMAHLCQQRNQPATAEDWLRKCLAARLAFYGPDHPNVSYVKVRLALLRMQQGDLHEAEQLLRDAIAIDERLLPYAARLIEPYLALAHIARMQGREELARDMLDRASVKAQAMLSADSLPDFRFSTEYARGLMALDQPAAAAEFTARLIDRFKPHFPPDSPRMQTLHRLYSQAVTGSTTRPP